MNEQRLIRTKDLERIAFATSESRDNQIRWTELAIYFRPGNRRPFVAESIGRTSVRGEVDFTRQRVGKSIEDVRGLFDNSRLTDEIVAQAQDWADKHPEKAGARAAPAVQFNGEGGLRGALTWLYNIANGDQAADSHLAKLFQRDWGVPVRTVTHALKQEKDGAGLPTWCLAFLGALQHFDRDAFHACRRV